jgi:hypothetical protein
VRGASRDAFCRRLQARHHAYLFGKKLVRQPFKEHRPRLAFVREQLDDLRLRPRLPLFGADFLHERRKTEAFERRPLFDLVDLLLKAVTEGDVREEPAHGFGFGRRREPVLVFRNLLGNLERVPANRAKLSARFLPP